jgi:glutamyl-tRNA synthetase
LKQAGLLDDGQAVPHEWLVQLVVLVRERAKTLVEMVEWVKPYFGEAVVWEEEAAKKFLTSAIAPALRKLLDRFVSIPGFSKQAWEEQFKRLVEEEGMKMGQLAQPVRVALTGRTASPGLFDVMEVLGRDRTLSRLRQSLARAETAHA